jgi:hypothetical protein
MRILNALNAIFLPSPGVYAWGWKPFMNYNVNPVYGVHSDSAAPKGAR